MNILAPTLIKFYGYVPGKFGLGEDVAASAMRQWARWCRNNNYFFDDPELPETRNFGNYSGPILAVGLDDDPWGRPELIDHITNHFTSAQITRRQFSPQQAGGAVGHFNFFKPRYQNTLWQPVAEWLIDHKSS